MGMFTWRRLRQGLHHRDDGPLKPRYPGAGGSGKSQRARIHHRRDSPKIRAPHSAPEAVPDHSRNCSERFRDHVGVLPGFGGVSLRRPLLQDGY